MTQIMSNAQSAESILENADASVPTNSLTPTDILISLRRACHANLRASSENEKALKTVDGYGPILTESSKSSCQPSLFANSQQESLPSTKEIDSTRSSKGFAKQGFASGGKRYQLQPLAGVIGGKESGLLPTAAARDWKDTPGMAKSKGKRSRIDQLHRRLFHLLETPSGGGKINLLFRLWFMGYPIQHFGNKALSQPETP